MNLAATSSKCAAKAGTLLRYIWVTARNPDRVWRLVVQEMLLSDTGLEE
jgi:hypothetical protein